MASTGTPTSIEMVWNKRAAKAAILKYTDPDSKETIEIHGKSDVDEEYKEFLDEKHEELGISPAQLNQLSDEEASEKEVSLVALARVTLLALTVPEDREKWNQIEELRGEKMGLNLIKYFIEKIEQGIEEKKPDAPTGEGKRS